MALPARFFSRTALGLTVGFQPEIVPSSVTKRKKALALGPTRNPEVVLTTVPVGAAVPVPSGVGITTEDCFPCCSRNFTPVALYRVETPLPLSETHQGLPEPLARPQGFTRSPSTLGADGSVVEASVVRSVRTYRCASTEAGNSSERVTARAIPRSGECDIQT